MIEISFIVTILAIVLIYMLLAKAFDERIAYIGVSIIPLSSILLTIMLDNYLNQMLGEWGVMGLGLGMLLASPVLGLMGIVLVVHAFRQRKNRISFLTATVVAYVPLIIVMMPKIKG